MAVRTPVIAREGWPLIFGVLIAAAAVHYTVTPLAAVPLWLLGGGLLFLFRDPQRTIPTAPLGVVSPVDARVLKVESGRDAFLEREAQRICLKMYPTGIFSIRSPIEGRVMQQWFAAVDQGGAVKDYHAQWIQTDEGDDLVLAVSPGLIGRLLRCYAQTGERLGQGQRCGFIYFGARIELLLPANSRILVEAGDRVRAGSDLLANLVHRAS